MGLRTGSVYSVRFEPRNAPIGAPFTAIFLGGVRCPYANDTAFWKNWSPPDDEQDEIEYQKREAIRQMADFAWKEGYDACREGRQRRSPYSKKGVRVGEHGSDPDREQ
jgi:hypothetical protein